MASSRAMSGDESDAAAPGNAALNAVERIKRRQREIDKEREKLVAVQRDGYSQLRALNARLSEAIRASLGVGGEAADIAELHQLQRQVQADLEMEDESIDSPTVAPSEDPTSEAQAVTGKRKREGDRPSDASPIDDSDATLTEAVRSTQPLSDLNFDRMYELDESDDGALGLSACFRIATRYLAMTGSSIPDATLAVAFESYTGKSLPRTIRQEVAESCEQLGIRVVQQLSSMSSPGSGRAIGLSPLWTPGIQFLDRPSLALVLDGVTQRKDKKTIDTVAAVLRAYIDVEKRMLSDLDQSALTSSAAGHIAKVRSLHAQAHFAASMTQFGSSSAPGDQDVYAVLSDSIRQGNKSQWDLQYRGYREFSGVFLEKESYLRQVAESVEHQVGVLGGISSTPQSVARFDKAFSLEGESIIRQVKPRRSESADTNGCSKRRKIANPSEILCPYELNGVCKDDSCSYVHQRDYDESAVDEELEDDANQVKLELSRRQSAFLAQFTSMRKRFCGKWPIISSHCVSSSTTGAEDDGTRSVQEEDAHVVASAESNEPQANGDDAGFVALGSTDSMTEWSASNPNLRYYDNGRGSGTDESTLEKRVEEDPDDVDAWLRLAVAYLDLDITWSEDAARISEETRLTEELVLLCRILRATSRGGSSSTHTIIDRDNLKKAIHSLSRALEVESNAYREAVWLMYLHLCRQLPDQEMEREVAQKAVQFVPGSHRLWLWYLSVFPFDSIKKGIALYGRILELLTQTPGGDAETSNPNDETTSVLLIAVVLHFCTTALSAGSTSFLFRVLDAIVYGEPVSDAFPWCEALRSRLRTEDMVTLHLVYGHALVFGRLPKCVEEWVIDSCCQDLLFRRFMYTIESFRHDLKFVPGHILTQENCAKVLDIYSRAFDLGQHGMNQRCRPVGAHEVILNNWIIAIAELNASNPEASSLDAFLLENLPVILQYPGVSFTAAKLMAAHLSSIDKAQQLLRDMIHQSTEAQFPAALHYYLFACHHFPELVNSLDEDFIVVMNRLAESLKTDPNTVRATLQAVKTDPDTASKSRTLEELLAELLGLWMDQLSATPDPLLSHSTDDPVNIYVAMAICHLMNILLEPSVAINGLERVLRSSKLSLLSVDARNTVWTFRFLLQVNLMEREIHSGAQVTEVKPDLIQLLKRFLTEMNGTNELTRQATARISRLVQDAKVQEAVIECLYPGQHQTLDSDTRLGLFQLCLSVLPGRESALFFSAFAKELAPDPRFALAFADAAIDESEWRAARVSLKRALSANRATPWHSELVRAMVAGDVKRQRMRAASALLEAEAASSTVCVGTWQVILMIEIFLGEPTPARTEELASALARRFLEYSCNSYGDTESVMNLLCSSPQHQQEVKCRGLRLHVFPRSILLHEELLSLDLSGNCLAELPSDIDRLQNLELLDVSENCLVALPDALSRMRNLRRLNVSHNNLVSLPFAGWTGLVQLVEVDCRFNMLRMVDAHSLLGIRRLKTVRAEGNLIAPDALNAIKIALASKVSVNDDRRQGQHAPQADPDGNGYVPSQQHSTGSMEEAEIDLTNDDDDETNNSRIMLGGDAPATASASDAAVLSSATAPPNSITSAVDTTTSELATTQSQSVIDLADEVMGADDTVVDVVADAGSGAAGGLEAAQGQTSRLSSSRAAVQDASVAVVEPDVEAFNKLTAYMAEHAVASRAEVRTRNPNLWNEFVASNIVFLSALGNCALCDAPDRSGSNQRFNSMVLCVQCLEDALTQLRSNSGASPTRTTSERH